jgi:hypothetical protein
MCKPIHFLCKFKILPKPFSSRQKKGVGPQLLNFGKPTCEPSWLSTDQFAHLRGVPQETVGLAPDYCRSARLIPCDGVPLCPTITSIRLYLFFIAQPSTQDSGFLLLFLRKC